MRLRLLINLFWYLAGKLLVLVSLLAAATITRLYWVWRDVELVVFGPRDTLILWLVFLMVFTGWAILGHDLAAKHHQDIWMERPSEDMKLEKT